MKMENPFMRGVYENPDKIYQYEDTHLFQRYYKGIRAMYYKKKLYNERGRDISISFPELIGDLVEYYPSGHFDGVIIADNPSTLDLRKNMAYPNGALLLATHHPVKFVIVHNFSQHKIVKMLRVMEEKSREEGEKLYQYGLDEKWAGIIAKSKDYKYQVGGISMDWIIFRSWQKETLRFTKYKQSPKGFYLSNPKANVEIRDIDLVKEITKQINTLRYVNVEIRHLGVFKSNGMFRTPRFERLL